MRVTSEQRLWLFAAAALFSVAACSSSTEPRSNVTTHPAGVVRATVSVGLRPYGIGLASGTAVVTQLDGAQIVRIDVASARVLDSIQVGNVPTGIALFAKGAGAAVTNQMDGNVEFLDLTSKQSTGFVGAPSTTFRVVASLDEKHVYATASAGSLGVIALPGHSVEASVAVGGAPNGLAQSPDGNTLYVSAMFGGITVINARTNAAIRTIPLSGTLQDIVVSPDGKDLYVADESGGSIHVLDAASGNQLTNLSMGASVFGLSLTPDGKQLYATSPSSGAVWVIDRASGSKIATLSLGGIPRRIAFDETGKTAVVSNEAGSVTIIE